MTKKIKWFLASGIMLIIIPLIVTGVYLIRESYASYFENLASQYIDRKDLTNAISVLERAMRLAPNNSQREFQLFDLYVSEKEYEKAVALAETALRKYPDFTLDFQRYYRLGELCIKIRQYHKAIPVYQRMIQEYPTSFAGDLGLSLTWEGLGDLEKAHFHKHRALELAKKDTELPVSLVQEISSELYALEAKLKER